MSPSNITIVSEKDFAYVGSELIRPECVIALSNGRLIVTNFDGGVTVIEADGTQWHLLAKGDFKLKPNGIALLKTGAILTTHLGDTDGGVYELVPDGTLSPFLLTVEGRDLPPTNFVHRDAAGRTWITVSTRQVPRSLGYCDTVSDGFLVLVDQSGARIVADNLGFANECLVTPDGMSIYINETFSRRVRKFSIAADGQLSEVATFDDFEQGEFPDGMALDREGGLWIASIISNRIIRITPDFDRQIIVDGCDPQRVLHIEAKYRAGTLTSADLGASNGNYGNLSSLAFGGKDLKRVYLGNLLCSTIAHFDQAIAGQAPAHWHFDGPKRISTT